MVLINYYRQVPYLSHAVGKQAPGKGNCPLSYWILTEKFAWLVYWAHGFKTFLAKCKRNRFVHVPSRPTVVV